MAHTPGPWRVQTFEGNRNFRIHPAAGHAPLGSLADVYGSSSDATLMAAARLAALNFQRQSASDVFLGDDDHEAWGALAAAIAKAEGR